MSRLSGWFRSSKDDAASKESELELISKETEDMNHAMECAGMVMNDDIDGAWEAMQEGDSSFHELGAAVTTFMRSILGLEKEVMLETASRLNNCETRAGADLRKAQRMTAATSMYPAGTEYELVRAETQLMGAVVGVLNESLMEAVRSFIKVRKAYYTLEGIINLEEKAMREKAQARTQSVVPGTLTPLEKIDSDGDDSSASEFIGPGGARPDTPDEEPSTGATSPACASPPPMGNAVDVFVHSGANLCFGIILLILTIVPPAFSRLLSIVGFRGDRPRGVRMLWSSAACPNVNGAAAALVLLAYYNGLLGFVDILPAQADYDDDAEIVGPPKEKCQRLLSEMRTRYPESGIWLLEEARAHANERRLSKAIEVGKTSKECKMKQVTSLIVFELAMNSMHAQEWETMRDSFARCSETNDWSPAMYSYLVACAAIELYRDAHHAGDAAAAEQHKAQAVEYLTKVSAVAGKKRMRGKQLPFERFAQRKVDKWEARAKALGVDLVDAVGVSPAVEMSFLWNGQKRMAEEELEKALTSVRWERCTVGGELVDKMKEEKDEVAVWAICNSVMLSRLGRMGEARSMLEDHVLCHDKSVFKGGNKDDYVLPAAIYEMGVIAWFECSNPPADVEDVGAYRREKAKECRAHLEKILVWERYVLDARIGLRVQSGIETLAWFDKKMA
ncbi:hypothetical protein B0I35DRAFT_463246 [Stachybotrys elegans]|uniref:Inclusion body clearance protein IML2 n=1 Tax=Stachybotrys elegans TaxID=80388 RepID=A0A8K0SHZ3_9HYPO|nr:hypothetical protein B0I35DRAFT_463246 [Stachybotrys elegans]